MIPTGPLSLIGVAVVAALAMATLIGQGLGRKGLARVFSIAAIAVTANSTNQIPSKRLAEQPFPDAQEVTEVTWRMVHGQQYTITLHGTGPRPPRYAPGYPIALAPFALMGSEFPGGIPRGAAFYTAFYVVAVCLAAWTMGGAAAGALAALIVGISPFARDMAPLVMSDAIAAGLTMLLIPLLHKPTRNRALWAGFLAGSLVAVRLPMLLNLAALFVALPRTLWSRAILGATIPLAAYAAFNHVTYGGPFTTGYAHYVHTKNLSLGYVTTDLLREGPWITPDALQGGLVKLIDRRPSSGWSRGGPQNDFPNYIFYPAVLSGVFWVFTPPLLSLLGLWSYWRDRNRPEARFALVLCGISIAFFCCYFYQGTRFMAAPASALLVGSATRIARWLARDTSTPIANEPVLHYTAPRSSRIRRRVTSDSMPAGWKVEQVDPHVLQKQCRESFSFLGRPWGRIVIRNPISVLSPLIRVDPQFEVFQP